METPSESNAVDILSWIFDELDTQKFGIKNNKHFDYFDDSEVNIQKINHFYLNLKPLVDCTLSDKSGEDIDGAAVNSGRNNNGNKHRPNQGDTGDFNELWRSRFQSTNKNEKEDKIVENDIKKQQDLSILESPIEDDELKNKNLNFEGFNPNLSLNPEENRLLRKYKSDYQINLSNSENTSSKKLARSLSTSALVPPVLVHLTVKFTNFHKEKTNSFFSSSNRSLFNSTILTDESGKKKYIYSL